MSSGIYLGSLEDPGEGESLESACLNLQSKNMAVSLSNTERNASPPLLAAVSRCDGSCDDMLLLVLLDCEMHT